MRKLLLASAMALIAAAPLVSAPVMAKTKIGMITTLSGGGSHLGIDVRDGFLLAMKQAGDPAEVLVRDDARKPDVAKSHADELLQKEGVPIMTGIIWSNIAIALVPQMVRGGTFYLSPNAGPSKLAGKLCHQNYFNVSWQNDNLPEAMGAYMKDKGFKKPLLLAPNYPAGQDMMKGFQRYFGTAHQEIFTKLGQKDYAAEISQIRASGADSLFYFLPGGMGIAFMKQYAAAGVDLPVYGPVFSFDHVILGAIGDAAIGVVNTTQWSRDLDNAANKTFMESFRAEYGRDPTFYASQGYDTGLLIASALAKADPESDPDGFRAALKAAEFDSTRGPFAFNTNNHPIQNVYVQEVVQGESQPVNQLVGTAIVGHKDAYAAECKLQ
ncbi:MAG: ABC transporter substrate-binding protein [Pseudomonadota bacterium]